MVTYLFSVKEVAEHLGVSTEHVKRLIRTGRLEASNIAVGKHPYYRISKDQLNQLLAAKLRS